MTTTRHSQTRRLMAFVKDRPGVWISAFDFEQFGALCWRTEISRARKRFEAARDGTIENSLTYDAAGLVTGSFYRYVPEAEPVNAPTPHDLNQPSAGRLI